jgi:hypothetical protein
MSGLLKKSRPIYLVLGLVFILSFGVGYTAGRLGLADFKKSVQSPLSRLSRELEYKVPGYGDILETYKNWHRTRIFKALMAGQKTRLVIEIFLNNFLVANLTMIIRALFFFPLILYPFGHFLQGLSMAQSGVSAHTLSVLLSEFGGYFMVIGGTLCFVFWTVFPKAFGFTGRGNGFRSGLKFLCSAFLLSGVFHLVGSLLEVSMLFNTITSGQGM